MKMTTATVLIPFAVAVIAQFSDAHAATITVCPVGCEHATIQGAISHAKDGDTILIYKGHYFETINTRGKALTVEGINNRQVIVDANGTGSVITIPGSNLVTIRSLTITRGTTHADGEGGGITITDSASANVIDSNVVANSFTTYSGAGGIYVAVFCCTVVRISGCTIADNNGVGIRTDGSVLDIENSTIARNIGGGIGISAEGSNSATISNSSIVDNTLGAGINVGGGQLEKHLTVKDSTIAGNSSVGALNPIFANGGGIFADNGSKVTLENVVVAHNSAGGVGGGIFSIGGVLGIAQHVPVTTLKNTYIVLNSAAVDGGGTYLEGDVVNEGGVVVQGSLPDNCGKETVCP